MGIDLHLFQSIPKADARRMLGLDQNIRYILLVSDPNRAEKRFDLAQQAVSFTDLKNVELLTVSDQPHDKILLFLNAGVLLLST